MVIDHPIIIALGSNHKAQENVAAAQKLLQGVFENVTFSKAIWTDAIETTNYCRYLNCVAWATTSLSEEETVAKLKHIEHYCGDNRQLRAENKVLLDLDLLFYQDHRLHEKDWTRPYIQQLTKAGKTEE